MRLALRHAVQIDPGSIASRPRATRCLSRRSSGASGGGVFAGGGASRRCAVAAPALVRARGCGFAQTRSAVSLGLGAAAAA